MRESARVTRRHASSHTARHDRSFWLLVATIAWAIFAAGGAYIWTAIPILAMVLVMALMTRPQIARSGETRLLDLTLIAALVAAALQLVPLPRALRLAAFPQREAIKSQLLVGTGTEWQPLSLDPWAAGYALALIATVTLVFWTCRYLAGSGLAPRIAAAVALVGLLAALTAIAQRAGDPTKIYGIFDPVDAGARPFGPFVNRNHFATWAVMAIPLAIGYVVASFLSRPASVFVAEEIATLVSAVGSRGAWVAVSAATMSLALVASTSRSGLFAFLLSLGIWMAVGLRRFDRRGRIWLTLGLVVLGGFLVTYARVEPLLSRAEETLVVGTGGRSQIWVQTLAIIRDFWPAGIGLGSYPTAMLVYQQTDRTYFINHAHNQYLQILAEGGVLVMIPAVVAIGAFIRLFVIRLRRDASSSIWLRVGAVTALLAVGVQSFWETGLRMPANAILFAVAAAIAVHRPR